ncbi:hypothetical protein ATY75_12630 [Rhizobium sp. N122]|nr:hypothetical protein ATY75_12630 [Rhizobium sp. N122]
MIIANLLKITSAIIVGAFAGYFFKAYLYHRTAEYPKCIIADNGALKSATGGPVIEVGEIPDAVMVGYIFDKTCGADPVIDQTIALAYLQQGGRVSLKETAIILSESRARGYVALQSLIENTERQHSAEP